MLKKKISMLVCRCLHFIFKYFVRIDDVLVDRIEKDSKSLYKVNTSLLSEKSNPKNLLFERINIITHAGGGMCGLSYLNCEESFDYYYNAGNRVFEYDVEITADNKFVLAHNLSNSCLEEYLSRKIDDRFRAMSIEKSLDNLIANDDVIIVYDCKFNNLSVFAAFIKNYVINESALNRVVIQVFNESNIEQVTSVYNFQMLYVCMFNSDYIDVANTCIKHNIGAVSISAKALKERVGWDVFSKKNIYSFAYTINSLKEFNEILKLGVKGAFSDFLLDEEIKKA